MNTSALAQSIKASTSSLFTPIHRGVLQRKCACGQHTVAGGECEACGKKREDGQARHMIQTKLAISTPCDRYEQEADRVADTVMRMPTAKSNDEKTTHSVGALVQRRISAGEGGLTEAPPIVDEVLRFPGQPLDADTRAYMEPRFGYDFSRVRVHTDAKAAESARVVNASAYTVGQDIVLGAGQYLPRTAAGRRLIAHELTHVVQQAGEDRIRSSLLQRQSMGTDDPQCGDDFKYAFDGVINSERSEAHRGVPRMYYADVAQAEGERKPGESPSKVKRSPIEPLATGTEVLAGQLDRFNPLWRAVCHKPKHMPRQILWVLNEYISRKDEKQEKTDDKKRRKARSKGPTVELWIDNFKDVYYDPDYRLEEEKYGPTNWLLIEYDDGTVIDLNFSEIADEKLSGDVLRNAFANAKLGKGGRLTPAIMNQQTTPRLWQAKQDALETQAWLTTQLITASLGAVFFVLTMGPQTVGRGQASPSSRLKPGQLAARHLVRSARLAQQLAEKTKAATGRVVVNLGGMKETPGAVNINILRSDTVKDPSAIPNLVRADAKDLGFLFPQGSVDKVVSFNVEPGRISWPAASQGAFKVLKPGGEVFIAPFGSAEAAKIAAALRAAGFQTVKHIKLPSGGEVVQAFKAVTP